MFSKIKDKIAQQTNIDFNQIISQIDVMKNKEKTVALLKEVYSCTDAQSKADIKNWMSAVNSIKANPETNATEKESLLLQIKTKDTVITFLKSVLDVLIAKAPVENKGLLQTGVKGLGMASSLMGFQFSGIAMAIFEKAVPKLVMTSQFDQISTLIEKEISI
jgi:ribonuclease D